MTAATRSAPDSPAHGGQRTFGHRLADHGIDRVLLLLVPGVLFLVLLFVYPFLYGLQLSFAPQGGGGPLANYQTFFSDPYLRDTIWTTLSIGVPAALLNVLVSVPIAYRMRGRFRGGASSTAQVERATNAAVRHRLSARSTGESCGGASRARRDCDA